MPQFNISSDLQAEDYLRQVRLFYNDLSTNDIQ